MRIAYIAPYQSPCLVKRRPSERNLSLAARVKIQLIAELLRKSSHQVDVISPGTVDRRQFRFYPSFLEPEPFHPEIPVQYVSALPIQYISGFWEAESARRLFNSRHKNRPYDAVIIYGLGNAQVRCAQFAINQLRLPVILEYEDDAFLDVHGKPGTGLGSDNEVGMRRKHHWAVFRNLFESISGVMAPSSYLLSQVPEDKQKMLLRAVISDEILSLRGSATPKQNWVVFSGTHEQTQGLEQTLQAWRMLKIPDWELHIAGQGPLTPKLQSIAAGDPSIVFHGLLDRAQNARMLCAAKIGMNPQDPTRIPGNVFAFKIVEYLASGAHVVTTPRGAVEPDLEKGITYIQDNTPATIAESLREIIQSSHYTRTAEEAAVVRYGPATVSKSLNSMLAGAVGR